MDDMIEHTTDNSQADTGELSVQQAADVPDMPLDTSPGNGRYKILKSGATYDLDKGRIVAQDASKNPYSITKQTSQDMHKLRRAHTQRAILQGIADGTKAPNWHVGVRNMSAALAQMVLAKHSKASDQFLALLRAGDLIDSGRTPVSSDVPPSGAVLNLSAEAWAQVLEAIQVEQRRREGSE